MLPQQLTAQLDVTSSKDLLNPVKREKGGLHIPISVKGKGFYSFASS
jgi:hypothetical protein